MHPEAVCGRAVALPPVPGSLLHTPVCVGLQHTHLVTLKEQKRDEKTTPIGIDWGKARGWGISGLSVSPSNFGCAVAP